MDGIKSKIGKVGLLIAALGIMSIVLSFFNYYIKLLAWIEYFGPTTAWFIRIALIVVGGALFFFLGREEEEEQK